MTRSVDPRALSLLALGLGACLTFVATFGRRRTEATAAAEVLPAGEHDFGVLIGAVRVEHEFRVRNDGPEAWHVVRTFEECGCARIASATREVRPGADLAVSVVVDTRGVRAERLERRAFVEIADGARWLAFDLRADIQPGFRVDPPAAAIELAPGESSFCAAFTATSPEAFGRPRIESERATPDLEVAIGEPSWDGTAWSTPLAVRGWLAPEQDRRTIEHAVVLARDGAGGAPERRVVRLDVARKPALTVAPGWLVLSASARRGEARVRDAAGRAPAELSWTSDPEGAVRVEYDAASGRAAVIAEDEGARARVTLRTGDGSAFLDVVLPGRR